MLYSRYMMVLIILLTVTACSSITVENYSDNTPRLVLEDFYSGHLTAYGIVKNRGGEVIRYFKADLEASWDGGVGTLDESFVFDDGERQKRIWTLRPAGEGRYIGTATDVIGEAVIHVAGNSMFLEYVLRIPFGDSTLDLTIDDRMYLVSENVIINESIMTKFGVRVGSLALVIQKHGESSE